MAFAVQPAPGVPALLGGFAPVAGFGSLADISTQLPASLAPMWGIFLNGSPVVTADSVISMDARQESVVADYPLEGGKFESYDKVDRPFDVRFRFSAGGNDANRGALIASVKELLQDKSQKYMFVAPEDTFEDVTISHYDYHRTSTNGVGLVVIDVWGWQLLTGQSQQTGGQSGGTQSVGASSQTNLGTIQLGNLTSSTSPVVSVANSSVPSGLTPQINNLISSTSSSPMVNGGSSPFPPPTSSLFLQ